jgi:hypothetical protein
MKHLTCLLAAAAAFIVAGDGPLHQDSRPKPPAVAAKADVESIDAIVKALYDVISGPPGQPRNWDRFRSLFIPQAQLVMASESKDGTTKPRVMSPEEYEQKSGPNLMERGFFEREIARHVDEYGAIAQVFSTYEWRLGSADAKAQERGINSIQLMKDKDRWWVVSIFWCRETPARPIPPEYLPK